MIRRTPLEWLILAIAGLTVLTGAIQIVAPIWILQLLGAERTATTGHFFGIVGMFMVIVGGLACHALAGQTRDPIIFLWAGLQKFGASVAVGLGVAHKLFSTLALLVAGFDFLSGLLFIAYWVSIRSSVQVPSYGAR